MPSDFCVKCIKHPDLKEDILKEIIKLKVQHWDYTFEEHKEWIRKNIKDDDSHLLIEDSNGSVIAYLNIVSLTIRCDESDVKFKGIGNVCVNKLFLKKGVGLLLMDILNYFMKADDCKAVLLCKDALLNFYSKSGWKLFDKKVLLTGNVYNGVIMFNCDCDYSLIEIAQNF